MTYFKQLKLYLLSTLPDTNIFIHVSQIFIKLQDDQCPLCCSSPNSKSLPSLPRDNYQPKFIISWYTWVILLHMFGSINEVRFGFYVSEFTKFKSCYKYSFVTCISSFNITFFGFFYTVLCSSYSVTLTTAQNIPQRFIYFFPFNGFKIQVLSSQAILWHLKV